ncbi:hypothetical protein [Streptomyces melanogenes]|uniref:Uncharacterized protein n=1 Tax=Streptomyces melanogenes TaxID=67326 RepID=A0ABZ1XW47_9ACTN|nr:hypothetical protein [Streptomyces melanogenes]
MLFEKKMSPVVLRDGPDILAAVRTALAQAVPGEQAGLERAADIIEAHCAFTDDDLLGRWVRGILADAGVDSRSDHVQRVITLRKAVPELTLTTAHRLVVNAVGE